MIKDKLLDMGTVTTVNTTEVKSNVIDFGAKKDTFGNTITYEDVNDFYFVVQLTAITTVSGTITIKFYTDNTDGATTVVFQTPAITLAAGLTGTYLYNGTIPVKLARYCSYGVVTSASSAVSCKGHIGHVGTSS